MTALELLAPAKNLECGIAAIDHGADALYIGAERFGARAAVGNSTDDIRQLCDYARPYGVKVYVTVNTIIYDDELEATRQLIWQLYEAGVDAILVQDMGILKMDLPPIALHASTQTDNRTAEKVRWLRDAGFTRVVLARELSADEIAAIHREVPDVELEAFVHGALCVSYSGQCYASQYCFGRSANRGECAQFCRMKFDLVDAEDNVLVHDRYLLSLKDMNRIDRLQQLAEAGVVSFKIEGRLKDVSYVKNVTAAYSEQLNALVRSHPDQYRRASRGCCKYTFKPNLAKTFNRGYTHYFLDGREPDIACFDTPKAMGEFVGTVKELRRDSFNVAGLSRFSNGDGLCFLDSHGQLQGFRVNRVEGNRLYPHQMPQGLRPGQRLYRNNDQEFERLLSKPSAERKIPLRLSLKATPDGFSLSADGIEVTLTANHQQAEKPQRENIVRQLSKFGGTPFECVDVDLPADFNYFIPSSQLATIRRMLCEKLMEKGIDCRMDTEKLIEKTIDCRVDSKKPSSAMPSANGTPAGNTSLITLHSSLSSLFTLHSSLSSLFTLHSSLNTHLSNISNRLACSFYGVSAPTAYELQKQPKALLMQCRHCLRYSLGLCAKHPSLTSHLSPLTPHHSPLFLRLGDGRRFRLEFDCRNCQMNVYAEVN